ncbi:MAG: hypothetical protein GY852_02695 [bacterium]|nr:hypothetical protein [bacterium]
MIYFRILATFLFFPAALIGYIPLLFGKPSLPELFTDIRFVEIDRRLDPRPVSVIAGISRKATIRMRTLTYSPLAAAIAAVMLLHSAPQTLMLQQTVAEESGLSQEDQDLLSNYLQLISLHPEELEYHVRLASLYHRNDMQQDLANELSIIAEIDPEHAILILADTTSISFEMLEPADEDSAEVEVVSYLVETVPEATEDSTATDSVFTDSIEVQTDSSILITDVPNLDSLSADTATVFPETLPDTLPEIIQPESLSQTEFDQSLTPDEGIAPAENEIQEVEEDTVEPDTIIQP